MAKKTRDRVLTIAVSMTKEEHESWEAFITAFEGVNDQASNSAAVRYLLKFWEEQTK